MESLRIKSIQLGLKIQLLFLLILSSFQLSAQSNLDLIFLDTNSLSTFIQPIAHKAQLIGLGEASHGTHEFTLIKSQIVKKLLVENSYQYLFLEASYLDCLKLNDYIHERNNDTLNLFKGIPWPYATIELFELLNWLRYYCKNHPNFQLIGTDLGNYGSIRYLIKDKPELLKTGKYKDEFEVFRDSTRSSHDKINYYQSQLNDYSNCLNFEDSFYHKNLIETLLFIELKGGKRFEYREIRFAKNAIQYMKHYKDSKFILWAHNEHITKRSNSRKSCGYFIKKEFKSAYINFGFDFNKGKFLAVDIDSNRYEKNVFKWNVFGVNPIGVYPSNVFSNESNSLSILKLNKQNRLKIRTIGAIYGEEMAKKKPELYFEKIKGNRSFDYLIVVPISTPIYLYK